MVKDSIAIQFQFEIAECVINSSVSVSSPGKQRKTKNGKSFAQIAMKREIGWKSYPSYDIDYVAEYMNIMKP